MFKVQNQRETQEERREKGKGREEGEKHLFIHSTDLLRGRTRPGQSQEPRTESRIPLRVTGTELPDSSSITFQDIHISRKLNQEPEPTNKTKHTQDGAGISQASS